MKSFGSDTNKPISFIIDNIIRGCYGTFLKCLKMSLIFWKRDILKKGHSGKGTFQEKGHSRKGHFEKEIFISGKRHSKKVPLWKMDI